MSRLPAPRAPAGYRVHVEGRLDPGWSAWFDGLALSPEADGTTNIVVPDQAALHGLLAKVRDLGPVLISVEAIGPKPRGEPPEQTTTAGPPLP
ncbi:hypothetical protein [Paeniglutamicibacter psychrophenolicus]|uniref:Uncharacterized protein n=1 Tax=Paeniglutamicibacter psychrophenolicus TaxID=257454 RepID=A0ABS4WGB0_9MICC|nr:hypothetical protein [Paeniglutamicibacter psychrophenolicus]MBP2375205.1 hypothetical protein [Paeniglutamicibacter psychrophenolicus]